MRRQKDPDALNDQERLLVKEFLVDLDGKQAALRAGYSKNNPSVMASLVLARPHVKREIEKGLTERLRSIDLRADRTLYEIKNLAFANMQDFVQMGEDGLPFLDFSQLTREQWAAVQEYTEDATGGTGDGERKVVMRRRIKLAPKSHALELLAKYFKLLTEKVEVDLSDDLVKKLAESRQRRELLRIAS